MVRSPGKVPLWDQLALPVCTVVLRGTLRGKVPAAQVVPFAPKAPADPSTQIQAGHSDATATAIVLARQLCL